MLNALSKLQKPDGFEKLSAIAAHFSGPAVEPLSKEEAKTLGRLWHRIPIRDLKKQSIPAALATLGGFLMDHRSTDVPGLGVRDLNILVHVANRVRLGADSVIEQATLGMAAIAAVLEPAMLSEASTGRLVHWFFAEAAVIHGLQHLVPASKVAEIFAVRKAGDQKHPPWVAEVQTKLRSYPVSAGHRRAAGPVSAPDSQQDQAIAALMPLERVLPGGETIDFSLDGNSDDYCVNGSWYPAEPLSRWGKTPSALLLLRPAVPSYSRLMLIINLMPARDLLAEYEHYLTIVVNHHVILQDRWDTLSADRIVLDIGEAPIQGTVLPIAFNVTPPLLPTRLGMADGRSLGICISNIRLVAW
jgi:hypothetical protein